MTRAREIVKFGLITDVHHATHGQDLRAQVKAFVKDMNENFHPDFVIELGDLYGGSEASQKDLRDIDQVLRLCDAPAYYVFGNVDSWSDGGKEGFMETVGIDYTRLSFDVGNFHFVILDGAWISDDTPISPEHHGDELKPPLHLRLVDGDVFLGLEDPIGHVGHIPSRDIRWLKEDLATTRKKTIVFCHYPICIGPYWARLDNEIEVVKVLEEFDKVIAVFTGHYPRCHYRRKRGINYFIMKGMGQNCSRLGSYARITITEKELRVEGEVEQTCYIIEL